MNKKDVAEFASRVSSAFAAEVGYVPRQKGKFVREIGNYNRWFWLEPTVTHGAGELTLNIGVEVPALEKVVRLFPGLEKGNNPTFGGPIFRFADLTQSDLHDFIIKVPDRDEHILEQLRALWGRVANNVFQQLSTPKGWLETAESFLIFGKSGPMSIPMMGRVCVALKHALEGREDAENAINVFADGTKGRRVQDLEQAIELQRLLTKKAEVLSELRRAMVGRSTAR
jgi:hypothetical protein